MFSLVVENRASFLVFNLQDIRSWENKLHILPTAWLTTKASDCSKYGSLKILLMRLLSEYLIRFIRHTTYTWLASSSFTVWAAIARGLGHTLGKRPQTTFGRKSCYQRNAPPPVFSVSDTILSSCISSFLIRQFPSAQRLTIIRRCSFRVSPIFAPRRNP